MGTTPKIGMPFEWLEQVEAQDDVVDVIPWTQPVTGVDKAMALLMALPPDEMARVLRYLPPELIAAVMNEVHGAALPEREAREAIMKEAHDALVPEAHQAVAYEPRTVYEARAAMAQAQPIAAPAETDHEVVVEAALTRALGPERAAEIVEHEAEAAVAGAGQGLASLDLPDLVALLYDEHAPAIAVVLSTRRRTEIDAVLAELPPDRQRAVRLHLERMRTPNARVAARLEERLHSKLADRRAQAHRSAGPTGPGDAPGLPDVAFDDLGRLDSRAMRRVLRGVQRRDLLAALSDADDELRAHVLSNMPVLAAAELRDELKAQQRPSDFLVARARRKIAILLRRLAGAGEITLSDPPAPLAGPPG